MSSRCRRSCLASAAKGEWFVTAEAWDAWDIELVTYFIKNGHTGPGIDAFIRAHALSAGR